MSHFRHWLLVSLCLSVSGCQMPAFSSGIGPLWPRKASDTSAQQAQPGREGTQQATAAPDRQQQLRDLLTQGDLELTSGRFPDARVHFEQALQLEPDNSQAHHMLARISDQTQEYEAAERHYLAALSTSPADPNLLSDMGFSYLMQGEFAYANTYLQRALSIQKDHVRARCNLAAAAAYQGDYDTALAWLRQVGTEEQAQATLRKLVSNPPPRLHRKSDSRDPLPSEATPAAQELAARLREAKEQSSYDTWKREMARWSQDSRDRQNRSLTGAAGSSGPLRSGPMGRGIADEDLQRAMQAIDEDYERRSARLNQTTSSHSQNGSPYLPEPPARQFSDLNRPALDRWPSPGQQTLNPAPVGTDAPWQKMLNPPPAGQQTQIQQPPGYQLPSQIPQPYGRGPVFQNGQWVAPDTASTTQFPAAQPQSVPPQFRVPATDSAGGFRNGPQTLPGLNPIQAPRRMELLPPPADFRQSGAAGRPPGPPVPASGHPYGSTLSNGVWNPQQGNVGGNSSAALPAVSEGPASRVVQNPHDVDGTRRALALGMSAGPGSLFPMGAGPTTQGAASRQLGPTQQPLNRPVPQAFSGTGGVPGVGTALPGADSRFHDTQQRIRTPGQSLPPGASQQIQQMPPAGFGHNSQWVPGQVYLPPSGGAGSLNSNWQHQQSASPTWNHGTSQPINPQQQWSRPSPAEEHWRNGSLTSPTTRAQFGQPVSTDRTLQATVPGPQAGSSARVPRQMHTP